MFLEEPILNAVLVKQPIWPVSRVCPDGDLPVNLKMIAPSICIPFLFTACMCIVTGIRSSLHSQRRQITLMLAKQLWQPVSAMAEIVIVFGCG